MTKLETLLNQAYDKSIDLNYKEKLFNFSITEFAISNLILRYESIKHKLYKDDDDISEDDNTTNSSIQSCSVSFDTYTNEFLLLSPSKKYLNLPIEGKGQAIEKDAGYETGCLTITNAELKEILTRNDITDTITEINNENDSNR